EADILPEERGRSPGSAQGGCKTARVRVRQVRNISLTVIESADKGGGRVESGLVDVNVGDAERFVIDAVPAAQNGLGRQRISKADPRHELLCTGIPEI